MNNGCSTRVKCSSVACCLSGGQGKIFCVYRYAFYSSAFQAGLFGLSIYLREGCSNIYSHMLVPGAFTGAMLGGDVCWDQGQLLSSC